MAESDNKALAQTNEALPQLSSSEAGLLAGFGRLDILRQLGLMIGLAASVALGVAVVLWSKTPMMRPMGVFEAAQQAEVVKHLEQNNISFDISSNGAILVPADQYQAIQLDLVSKGVSLENDGENYLSQDTGFTVSQRLEKARLLKSRELELARTIEQIKGVKGAKVHLAIPKESVFLSNKQKPSASVMLNLYAGRELSAEKVQSIVDLVASSIPNLNASRVTVIDQNARLLNSGSQSSDNGLSHRELDMLRKREGDFQKRVEHILDQLVGRGHYTVQTNIDMDFTRQEETAQTYKPDPVVRNETTFIDKLVGAAGGGAPGTLSNQPPSDSTPGQANSLGVASTESSEEKIRQEAKRQYELDTTIRHIQRQVGILKHVSVSVALDYAESDETQGEKAPRTEEEIANITRLVKAAIGFNSDRGDIVEVVSFPFKKVEVEQIVVPEKPLWEQNWFLNLLKPAVALVGVVLLIFVVLKPLISRLSAPPKVSKPASANNDASGNGYNNYMMGAGAVPGSMVQSFGGLHLPGPAGVEVQKINQVQRLVEDDPALVAQVVKNWVEQ